MGCLCNKSKDKNKQRQGQGQNMENKKENQKDNQKNESQNIVIQQNHSQISKDKSNAQQTFINKQDDLLSEYHQPAPDIGDIKLSEEIQSNRSNKQKLADSNQKIQNLFRSYIAQKKKKEINIYVQQEQNKIRKSKDSQKLYEDNLIINNIKDFKQEDTNSNKEQPQYDSQNDLSDKTNILKNKITQDIGEFLTSDEEIFKELIFKQKYDQFERLDFSDDKCTVLPPIKLYRNQKIYKGSWNKEAERHGFGIYYSQNESLYEGQFWKNKKQGFGRIIIINGEVYEGFFQNDKFEGKGTFWSNRGWKFDGNWKNNQRNGFGKEMYQDGSYFEGNYENDKKQGVNCKYIYANGNSYQGEFQNDLIQGQGTFIWKKGKKYTGAWLNSKMHGFGKCEWSNGMVYEGFFVEDLYDGEGKMKFEQGDQYNGKWMKGKQHGIGTYITKNGTEKKGIWEKGTFLKWI